MRRGSVVLGLIGAGLVLTLVTGLGLFSYNNTFVDKEEQIKGKWAQVDNQLKRRADLIPNLLETVKGYAAHEKGLFTQIADARARLVSAGSVNDKEKASNDLTSALRGLTVVAEKYPELKANTNFTQLMDELAGTENRLAVERARYNEAVQDYNASLRRLPGSLFASILGFKPKEYFEVAAADKAAPQVKF